MNTVYTDVAVIGGGTAGPFAAICAAKAGARTVLIEKNSVLGGTLTTCGVNFPGLFYAWNKQIISGPCWNLIKELEAMGGADIPHFSYKPEHHWQEQIRLNSFLYAAVLEEKCINEGIDIRYHSMISDVKVNEDNIELTICSKNGSCRLIAKAVADTTGDANIAEMAGYKCVKNEICQPATLINNISGYDINKIDKANFSSFMKEAIQNNIILPEDFQGGNAYSSLVKHRISMHIKCEDASSSEGKTKTEIEARLTLLRIIRCLKEFPGLENIYVSDFCTETGIRESKSIVGVTTMTVDKYLNGYRYEDAVCYAFYPVDRHVGKGIEQEFLKPEIIPTVPYRALIPKGSKRLITAGRCISADQYTLSAVRVEAACMAMGQAAGTAAAISACKNISLCDIPYTELCLRLKNINAIVPD